MIKDVLEDRIRISNQMYDDIGEHLDKMRVKIELMPEGDRRDYTELYHVTMKLIADLYVTNATIMSSLVQLEQWVKPVWVEVFGDKELKEDYKPKGESLHEIAKKYKEKEPSINWLDKDLKDKAKDTEEV